MLRFLFRLLLLFVLAGLLLAGAAAYWALRPIPMTASRADFTIPPGSGLRTVAARLSAAGIPVQTDLFVLMSRLSGLDRKIQAGGYEATPEDSLWGLLQRMAQGDVSHARITFIEGWTYQQIRAALRNHPDVAQTLDAMDDTELLARLGVTDATYLEGLFFPDTYTFAKGSPDFDILRRAWVAQEELLRLAWETRTPGLPLQTPYEMLIMASIIEKETGHGPERKRISGVFANRLRIGMPLQTDPTVIYGMGAGYTGTITRRDLRTDTAWNTYTRAGLPPSPIASAGRASLEAAAHPEQHKYLYFVSRGDGTSEFATDLAGHNRNVWRYLRGGRQ